MSQGTNSERITQNNAIINDNNTDLEALKARINSLPDTSIATATAGDIASNKTAFVNGRLITGTKAEPTYQSKTVNPSTSQQVVNPDSNYNGLSSVTVNAVTSAIDNNIQAGNIKKDVSILGVTGTLESGSSGFDWSEIGYSNAPENFDDGIAYAKTIYDNWDPCPTEPVKFTNDTDLIFMPLVDTSCIVDMNNMFSGCINLIEIPFLDTSSVETMIGAFGNKTSPNGTSRLSNESIDNILLMCINATSYTGGKSLSSIGLISAVGTDRVQESRYYSDALDFGWTMW